MSEFNILGRNSSLPAHGITSENPGFSALSIGSDESRASPAIHGDNSSEKSTSDDSNNHHKTLWEEAYENKGKIAAALGAAAAAVGVAVIQHTPAGRALGFAKELLVIEDTAMFSHCIQKSLLKQGERVTILKGVTSLKPFMGILEDDDIKIFNLNKVKGAFVDGDLGNDLAGPDISKALRKKGVFTIAMSSEEKINNAMLANGANIGEQKSVIMQALREDTLRFGEAMRAPVKTQAELHERSIHFNEPVQSERRKTMEREMMTEFFAEEEAIAAAKKNGALLEHQS